MAASRPDSVADLLPLPCKGHIVPAMRSASPARSPAASAAPHTLASSCRRSRRSTIPQPSRRSITPQPSSRAAPKLPALVTPTRPASPPATVALYEDARAHAEAVKKLFDAVLESVRNGNDEAISTILQEGLVDVDAKDVEGKTSLIIACRDNRPTTAKLLLSHNADPNAKTRLGATALVAAATQGHVGKRPSTLHACKVQRARAAL